MLNLQLSVSADRLDHLPTPRPKDRLTDATGLLKCATCSQLYNLRVPGRVRADDVEAHIQILQSWIDHECTDRHPTKDFRTDGTDSLL